MNPIVDHLNKSVWARIAPSKIHGIGVFAIRDIPKGTLIGDHKFYKGYLPVEDLIGVEEPVKELLFDQTLFTQDELMFDHPNVNVCLRAFMNHSDKPNSDGITTLRAIKKGEEITENYHDCVQGQSLIEPQKKYMSFLK